MSLGDLPVNAEGNFQPDEKQRRNGQTDDETPALVELGHMLAPFAPED
jgi:hypothetical protein